MPRRRSRSKESPRPEAQPAAAVAAAGGGHASDKGIVDSRGLGVGGIDAPGDHLYLGTGVALAGVEPPVEDKGGIDDDPHQPGLSPGEQVTELGVDGLDRAVGESTAQHARPLGEQHRPHRE